MLHLFTVHIKKISKSCIFSLVLTQYRDIAKHFNWNIYTGNTLEIRVFRLREVRWRCTLHLRFSSLFLVCYL